MVTLLVGHEEQEMTVHGERPARNSACFRAALRQEWLEGQTRTVKLPDESQAIVQHYIEYVYSGKLPANTLTKDSTFWDFARPHYNLLAELYVLGERRLDPKFQNGIVKEFFKLSRLTGRAPGIEFVDIIHRGTTTESPARRMAVDCAAISNDNEYWLNPEFADYNHEFWFDLCSALFRRSKPAVVPVKAKNYLVREDTRMPRE